MQTGTDTSRARHTGPIIVPLNDNGGAGSVPLFDNIPTGEIIHSAQLVYTIRCENK